ncbi:MAG TPA: Hsp20/alpha crystallin family protein [Blastocatellia bacterium]|nr:Hsp20/alpha crystallin family protein [Blastocatellia bacterium]
MPMYSYDQVLTDVRQVYEQLTGLPAPKIDLKNPRFPLPGNTDSAALIQSEINYLNLYLINSGLSLRLSKTPTWAPPAEVYETPRDYVVDVEVAGLAEGDFTVQVINNTLIVRGARRFRRANEEAKYHASERAYGAFERLFPMPAYVQPDKLKTKLSDGILEIVIPKHAAGHTQEGGYESPRGKGSHASEEKTGGKK